MIDPLLSALEGRPVEAVTKAASTSRPSTPHSIRPAVRVGPAPKWVNCVIFSLEGLQILREEEVDLSQPRNPFYATRSGGAVSSNFCAPVALRPFIEAEFEKVINYRASCLKWENQCLGKVMIISRLERTREAQKPVELPTPQPDLIGVLEAE